MSRLGWLALAASLALAAIVDLGDFHHFHNADSIVPVLASLQHWTPFLWGEDRIGMLVPLLAMPIHHPFYNLLVENFLTALSGFACFFLLARYVADGIVMLASAALGLALYLVLQPAPFRYFYLGTNMPYGVALALALGGAVLLTTAPPTAARLAAATVALALACWVNLATPFVLGPLVALDWLGARLAHSTAEARRDRDIRALLILGALGFGFTASLMLSRASPYQRAYGLLPVAAWPSGWATLLSRMVDSYFATRWIVGLAVAVAVAAVVAIGTALAGGGWRVLGVAARRGLVLALAALPYFFVMGALAHVKANLYDARYLIPAIALVQGGACVFVATIACALAHGRARTGAAAALAATLVLAVAVYGRPSLARARADVDRTMGAHTAAILAGRASHLIGFYWTTWPAVFHANLALYEAGSARTVWGISGRATPTEPLWRALPRAEMRLAARADDRDVDAWARFYRLAPLTVVERAGGVVIWRPSAQLGDE